MSDEPTRIVTRASPGELLEVAGPLLLAEEARNSLLVGLANNLIEGRKYGDETPLFLTVHRGSAVIGAAMQTPPWHLVVSPLDAPARDALVAWGSRAWTRPTGVNGERAAARRVAEGVAAARGLEPRVGTRLRLFELRSVIHPPAPGGRMRLAEGRDHELVTRWYDGFHEEATPRAPNRLGPDDHLANGRIWLWVDEDDRPVSLAARNRELPSGSSIGPVYTPPELRGNGYASAIVAALSQAILDEGKRYACLFTDLANPTSNAIYPRVGYRPIADMDDWGLWEPGQVPVTG